MKKVILITFMFLSMNVLATEKHFVCNSQCANIGPGGEIYSLTTLSAHGESINSAWGQLKRLCTKTYQGYSSELMEILEVQNTGHYNVGRYFYRSQDSFILMIKDFPSSHNCFPSDDIYYTGDLPVLG